MSKGKSPSDQPVCRPNPSIGISASIANLETQQTQAKANNDTVTVERIQRIIDLLKKRAGKK